MKTVIGCPKRQERKNMKDWNIKELCGYEPHTTFYTDLSIADHFGTEAIEDTYKNVMKNWKEDAVFITEFCMALNWKIFEHYGKNDTYAKLYDKLWRKCDEWCMTHLKGDDLAYFLRTTD
jgi:hypothetical protein